MNKSLLTNSLAAVCVAVGLNLDILSPWHDPVLSVGMFALAGAATNWLAVYMLFEKVPGLYGSGVISTQFESFKAGIYSLVMTQFFSEEKINRFLDEMGGNKDAILDITDVIDNVDFDPAFEALTDAVKQSSFGGMLGMIGGEKVLDSLKEPFITKLKQTLLTIAHGIPFQTQLKKKIAASTHSDSMHQKIESMVQARLDELTAPMVKEIIQTMIKAHLSWLVVWGGVFGGLIGLVASQISYL